MSSIALFHFLRPWWLLLLFVPCVLIWWQRRHRNFASGWQQAVDAHLLPHLLKGSEQYSRFRQWFLPLFLVFLSIALSGPTCQRILDQSNLVGKPLVIALELSPHMLSTDISPSRLKRALFKLKDLVAEEGGREISLIAFAGDAHVVVPLTTDHRTMLSLSQNLDPSIMPKAGSSIISALKEAASMSNAKDVVLITSTNSDSRAETVVEFIEKERLRVMVWPFASEVGAPLLSNEGRFDASSRGKVQLSTLQKDWVATLNKSSLIKIINLSANDSDIKAIKAHLSDEAYESANQEVNVFDTWYDMGPYFVAIAALVFLLATALYGPQWWLFCLFLWLPSGNTKAGVADWFSRADERAYQALINNKPMLAAELYTDDFSKGSALFKAGKFEEAASHFAKVKNAEGFYNLGNTLAQLSKIPEAIKAYDEALKLDPKHADAQHNKEVLEKLPKEPPKEQEQKQNQQQEKQDQQGENKEQQQDNQQKGSNSQENSKDKEGQQQPGQDPKQEEQKSGEQGDKKPPEENKKPEGQQPAEPLKEEKSAPKDEKKAEARPDEKVDPNTQYYFKQLEQNNNFYLKRKFLYESQKKAGRQ